MRLLAHMSMLSRDRDRREGRKSPIPLNEQAPGCQAQLALDLTHAATSLCRVRARPKRHIGMPSAIMATWPRAGSRWRSSTCSRSSTEGSWWSGLQG